MSNVIFRLPLIAGPNPPGNLGVMIDGIKKNRYFNIDEGRAHKSIVMAEDVASWIAAVAPIGGTYNLTDGYHPSFAELAALIANQLDKKTHYRIFQDGLRCHWHLPVITLVIKRRSIPINFEKLLPALPLTTRKHERYLAGIQCGCWIISS